MAQHGRGRTGLARDTREAATTTHKMRRNRTISFLADSFGLTRKDGTGDRNGDEREMRAGGRAKSSPAGMRHGTRRIGQTVFQVGLWREERGGVGEGFIGK